MEPGARAAVSVLLNEFACMQDIACNVFLGDFASPACSLHAAAIMGRGAWEEERSLCFDTPLASTCGMAWRRGWVREVIDTGSSRAEQCGCAQARPRRT
jgi:hypothetical protein